MSRGARFLLFFAGAIVAMAQSESAIVTPAERADYVPITAKGRARWIVTSTIGPSSLIAGVVMSGQSTLTNSPPEYGTHWAGFGKRYGIRVTGRATSSLMEAGLGSLWGEDPRYFRTSGQSGLSRLGNVLRMTFMARDRAGNNRPAFARYIAIPGSTLLSNRWRADSHTQMADAIGRISFSLVSHVIGNAFSEFGPDLRKRFSKKNGLSAGK